MSGARRRAETSLLQVNGRSQPFVDETVERLVTRLGYAKRPSGIAVAVNGEVVPRARWSERRLLEGDSVEIVGAVQGG